VTRPPAEHEEADRWVRWGMNDCAIGRLTGIPRRTVLDWRHGARTGPGSRGHRGEPECPRCDGAPLDEPEYAYLLGLYLGDGCISACPRGVYRLRIALDQRYPNIIKECAAAMQGMRQRGRVASIKAIGCVEVYAYWKHWPCLFPQHGRGPKHRRAIRLESWQQHIVAVYPQDLLRGLIHSDGWRGYNRVQGRPYLRYQFSNRSADIRRIFTDARDSLGVSWRRMNAVNISVARAPDVAKLDQAIGPKT
jgi:hypothetical protein